MTHSWRSILRSFLHDESGQTLPIIAAALVALLGVAGLTIDMGRVYVLREQLQNGTNASALAAAGAVWTTSTVSNANSFANTYSSGATGDQNYSPSLGSVATNVSTKCLNLLLATGSCNSSSPANAVVVNQTATVSTYFMKIFGFGKVSLSTTATASMFGAAQPWNVAIIVDSTGSMATSDSNCGGDTEFQCALSGVQELLSKTNPNCIAGVSNCPNGIDFRVSLFTFPNVLTSVNGSLPVVSGQSIDSLNNDINCNGSPGSYQNWAQQPVAAPYTLPRPGAVLPVDSTGRNYLTYSQTGTGTLWTATYQITPFLSDYYLPSAASGLNPASQIVKAVGYGTTPGCLTYTLGIDGSNGKGSGFGNTYFASSIYAAQSALAAQQKANPGSKNAIIFLSDGQANASYYTKNSAAYGPSNQSNQYVDATEFPEAPAGSEVGPSTTKASPASNSYPVPSYLTPATILTSQAGLAYHTLSSSVGAGTRSGSARGTYPDWYDQCQQAIVAAQYAASAGTTVYAVAYGSEASGCSNGWSVGATDSTLVAVGGNQPFSSLSQLLPCTTMENIASSWADFFSDNLQAGNVNLGCTDLNHSTVSLQGIFQAIAGSFTQPKLLPNNAT